VLCFDCLVCSAKSLRVPSFRPGAPVITTIAACLSLLGFFGMANPLCAQSATTTVLTVANTSADAVSSVSSGTVVVLTASVTRSGGEVEQGTVKFCDTVSPHCEDGYLAGSAQLTSTGAAILKFKPPPGNHTYQAFFHGTTTYAPSVSSVENLTVTAGPFATTTTIVPTGSVGNYTLTATVMSEGEPPLAPTGPVDFLDSSNNNYLLGSAAFAAITPTSNYAPFVGYNPGGTLGVIVADFNQDGIPDLLVWGEGSYVYGGNNFIGILLGKGDGTYQNVTGYNFNSNAYNPSAIAVGDLNGDGYPDVVVADDQTNQLYVLLNSGNGDGRLGWQFTYGFPNFSYNGSAPLPVGPVTGIAIGDVNGDGKADVAITLAQFGDPALASCNYTNQGTFGVMLGNGNGSLQTTSSAPYVTAQYPSGFCAQPFDTLEPIELVDTRANGELDVVVTDDNAAGACVSLNNGDGTFARPTCYGAPAGNSVAVGDLNGDGYPDLVVSSWNAGAEGVLLGKGDGTFQNAPSNIPDPSNSTGVSSVALGDLNGDGKLDVVLGSNGASPGEAPGTFSVSYGNGDGTFGTAINVNATVTGDYVGGVAVADLNGDGVPDILASDNAATVNVMLGSLQTVATATVTGISPLGPSGGQDGVYASYVGDSFYAGSASAGTYLTTKTVQPTLALASNVSTVTVGGKVTLTATISPGYAQGHSPSNAVTFYMNGNSIGTATPSNGVATLKPTLTVVQMDSFTATYAGDRNFLGVGTTSAVSVTVQKASPTLTLQVCNYTSTWVCPATTSTYGGEITVTATLSPYSVTGVGSSDGETVTFYNNGTSIGAATLTDGGATLNLDQTAAGSYSFTASYGGDANFNSSSTSSPSTMTVAKVASGMSLTTYPVTSSPYGQQVELTAEFLTYPYNVSGETVTFSNGANVVGTAQLSSSTPTATLRLNNLPVGNYNFNVSYPGDSNFLSSSATAPAVAVQQLATTLTVSAPSSITFTYGSQVTVQVFLYPYNVQGGNTTNGEPVTLYQNGALLGTAPVSNGIATFTITAPPVGTDAYTASYAGDTSFAASTAAAGYVSVQQAATTMGIATNALNGIAATGQPVTLTATISSNLATGTAIFYQNGNDIGNGTVTNGVATRVVNGLPEGSYTFGASYGGDTNFSGSTASPTASVTVLQATTLTLTTNPAHYAAPNQPVTITVTLSPSSIAGDNTNGQMVYIYNGTSQFGNATLSNGVGSYTPTNGLPLGNYSFTAVYDSDGTLANATTSTPVAFAVVTGQLFVVNTSADDAGTAANCKPQGSTTTNSTDSACSLRDALLAAAAAPEGASVSFATSAFPAATTITLTNGGLTLPAKTTLTGPTLNSGGANVTNLVTVDGNGNYNQSSSTVFTVTGTGTAISNLTISGGWTPWNNGSPPSGGGIVNSGSLTLTNSTITGNGTIASGGGIYNTGTLTVVGSTFSNNTAAADGFGNGGGIDNGGGTLTVVNSTFANNSVRSGYGGGIAVDGGTATITNSTITGNSVGGGGGGISSILSTPGGVISPGGTFTLANTIVSGNNDFFSDIDDGGVAYTDQGGNIVGYINRTYTPVNDPTTLNLGPLDNYGGPTQTVLPLPGSQVICAANYLVSPSQWQPMSAQIDIDQRGYPNYNLFYGQLRWANGGNPLPSACFDTGAVQTNYQAVQFLESSYAGVAGGPVTPTVVASVTENGVSRQAVPLTLNYSGPGNLSGNAATTVTGSGAPFSSLSVDTVGGGTLSTTVIIAGTSYINASTNLGILPSLAILPGSETIYAAAFVPLSQTFIVSNGSGSYQLSNSGTLPSGLVLTPSGTATGASWTLSGTSSQIGSYNFTLTATDVTNSVLTLSQSYTLTIAPATTTTLAASPASTSPLGQTVTLTATVSSPTANGTVSFFDTGNLIGSAGLSGVSPNVATFAWIASTLGTHSFTAQFSGDASDAASISNTVSYNVTTPNFVVNTTSDDDGSNPCTSLASTTSNTTDGNTPGNPGLCTLRDALDTALMLGAGSVYFDTTVFAGSNPAANTIFPNIVAYNALIVSSNTTIQGLTSGSGATLTNLVTVDGGGSGVANNGTIFLASGTNAAINNLNINNGYASNGGSGGAIYNTTSLTVSGNTFTGNQATGSGGGIFNGFGGTLTVVNSTFSSNSALGGNGGAIDNANFYGCGTTTVTNSTFYQNTALNYGNGYGGAINNDGNGPCQVTVNSSTMVGNSTDNSNPSDGFGGGGGGIYSQYALYLANNVITGNTINGGGEDDLDDNFWGSNYTTGNTYASTSIINGNLIGMWNGYTENGTNVNLAAFGNYGGPTQTMVPLPGSAAICDGLAANLPAGVTIDQRGYPNTNTSYAGFNAGNPCVDSGAVQTNYTSVAFVQQPTNTIVSTAISPAPTVQVLETDTNAGAPNNTDAVNGIPVTLTYSGAGTLGGTLTQTTAGGVASFSGLTPNSGALNANLTTVAIPITSAGSGTTLAAQSSGSFNVAGGVQHFRVAAVPTAVAGTSFSITVTAVDSTANTVPSYTGTIQFTTSDTGAGVTLPANYTFTAADSGVHTFPNGGTLVTAGIQTVTVTDATNSTILGTAGIGVNKATATITLGNLQQTYSGSVQPPTVTTNPAGLAVTLTYAGSSTLPTVAGTYAVVAKINDPSYIGSALGLLSVKRGTATITLGNLQQTYGGSVQPPTVTTDPVGLAVTLTYAGSSTLPTVAGTYAVAAKIADPSYIGSALGLLTVKPGMATITLGNLQQTYGGSVQPPTVNTNPAGLAVTLTYAGSSTLPTVAGTYTVVAKIADPSYTGSALGVLTVKPGLATITLGNLQQTYGGSVQPPTVITNPVGLAVTLTYAGSSTLPTVAGTYTVVAKIADPSYIGSALGLLSVKRGTATITLGNLQQTYGGSVQPPTVTTNPVGLAVTLTYAGSNTLPTVAGTYAVVAKIADPSYIGSDLGLLTVKPGTATITLGNLHQGYTGTPQPVTVTTNPAGLAVTVTYNGSSSPPTALGGYTVSAKVNDPSYTGSTLDVLIIGKGTATIALGNLQQSYTGTPQPVTVTINPSGLAVTVTYAGSSTLPTAAGTYTVVAKINDPSYTGSALGLLTIKPDAATITLGNLHQSYTGTPQPVTVTTNPSGLAVTVTYNGSTTVPTAQGSYTVVAIVADTNYTGKANGTLIITP